MGSIDKALPHAGFYPDSQTYIWRCKDSANRIKNKFFLSFFEMQPIFDSFLSQRYEQSSKYFGRKIVIPTLFSNFSPFSFFISNLFLTFADASWLKDCNARKSDLFLWDKAFAIVLPALEPRKFQKQGLEQVRNVRESGLDLFVPLRFS